MFKRNGTYYLTYSAAGTENRTYAMGCSRGQVAAGAVYAAEEQSDPADDDRADDGDGPRLCSWKARTSRCGRSTR